jgi:hypothetical protein
VLLIDQTIRTTLWFQRAYRVYEPFMHRLFGFKGLRSLMLLVVVPEFK